MIRITPGLTEKVPQDKLSMLPPGQAFLISSVTFFRGFMPKKATFITTIVSVTAAMDTQKPHVESEQAHCSEQRHPNILPVHCVPSLTAARRGDEHRLFSSWSPAPCRAGCRYSLSAFISSQGTGRKPGGEILAFSSAANGTVFQVTLYRQIRTTELSLTRKLRCSVAGVAGDQCSALVGQAFVHS